MRDQSTPDTAAATVRNGVLVLTGYGITVGVGRGHLVVSDGIGKTRRRGRFSRAAREIQRLVVIGHTGTISFDALRWLHDTGAAFVQIDSDGQVIVASGPSGLNNARLRRMQALALFTDAGLEIAHDLIRQKLQGQAALLHRLPNPGDTSSAFQQAFDLLDSADSLTGIRSAEAFAAKHYWDAWGSASLQFGRQDVAKVPEHWKTFGKRSSLLSNSPRNATNPANAILNYLYAILEAEARIAALAVGLDPGIGILHSDQRMRDSLACDLMEVVRPQMDAFLLDMLTTRTFQARDFVETRDGMCRVMPALTALLAETTPRWSKAIAPVVERTAQMLWNIDPPINTVKINRGTKTRTTARASPDYS